MKRDRGRKHDDYPMAGTRPPRPRLREGYGQTCWRSSYLGSARSWWSAPRTLRSAILGLLSEAGNHGGAGHAPETFSHRCKGCSGSVVGGAGGLRLRYRTTAETLTPTAPAADGGTYGSAVELRDAVVEAGVDCPKWDEHNRNMLAATYGHIRLGRARALESSWPSGRSSGLSPDAWRVVFKVSAPWRSA